MYVQIYVSVRTNLFSLRFPGTCCTVSSVIVQEHCTSQKKHSYCEVPGTEEFDLLYTYLYLISLYIICYFEQGE